jgi:metal-responsive CopG/Arc/MetJ family transcriptional regulator
MKRVNINFDEDLLQKIDDYAKKLGVNRSATISMLCSEHLDQKEALNTLQLLSSMELMKDK